MPVLSVGAGVPPGVVAVAGAEGWPSAEEDGFGPGPGALVLTPGFGFFDADVLGFGSPDAPAAPALAEASGDAGRVAEGVVPSAALATAPGAGTAPLPGGCTDRVGRGEVLTWPAGVSFSWPGTGSQGASELPDSSVATITTA
ncbi:hypothetical protein [Streptomyces sp. NPDC127038]|uniref:hypothetical protein n=1 Tax=Streptomyces sp. NPDC127038 TaxID=3347114 RepID=UPI00364DA3BD